MLGLRVRAAAQVDRDVGGHAGGHAAHEVARLAHGPERLRHRARVRVVAGRRNIEGPAGGTAAARCAAGPGHAPTPDRSPRRAPAPLPGAPAAPPEPPRPAAPPEPPDPPVPETPPEAVPPAPEWPPEAEPPVPEDAARARTARTPRHRCRATLPVTTAASAKSRRPAGTAAVT